VVKNGYLEEVQRASFKCGSNGTVRDQVWVLSCDLFNPSLYLPKGTIGGSVWGCWLSSRSTICQNRVPVLLFPSCCTAYSCVHLHDPGCQTERPSRVSGCWSAPCSEQVTVSMNVPQGTSRKPRATSIVVGEVSPHGLTCPLLVPEDFSLVC
jgi:hypothetical protein